MLIVPLAVVIYSPAANSQGKLQSYVSVKGSFLETKAQTGNDSGAITTITPGVSWQRQGTGSVIDLNYSLDALFYHGLEQQNTEHHNLGLLADFTHKPGVWDTQLRGSIRRTNISADGIQILDPILQSDNTSELKTLAVTSNYQGHIADTLNYSSSISVDSADRENSPASVGAGINLSLDNYRSSSPFTWLTSMNSRHSHVEVNDMRVDRLSFNLRYRINAKLYSFIDLSNTKTSDDSYSSDSGLVGIDWSPLRETNVRLGVGRRDNVDSYSMNLSHKNRRMLLTASYSEDVITPRDDEIIRLNQDEALLNTFVDFSIQPVLQKRGDLALTWNGKRSIITLSIFNSMRGSTDASLDEKISGERINISRTLSRMSSLSLSLLHQKTQVSNQNEVNDWSLSYQRQLGKKLNFTSSLRDTTQKSDIDANEYDQLELNVALSAQF